MMPSVFIYHKKTKRWAVLIYLSILMLISITYIFWCSISYGFSSILTITNNQMFDQLFRRPFGPVGYYALGIMISIFYFEYSQAISNRDLRKRKTYIFLHYIGKTKTRCFTIQLIGSLILLFVVFIWYSSFKGVPLSEVN
jgi:hypothetical protein